MNLKISFKASCHDTKHKELSSCHHHLKKKLTQFQTNVKDQNFNRATNTISKCTIQVQFKTNDWS